MEKEILSAKKDITLPWIRTGSVHGRYIVTSKLTGELICEAHRESIAEKIISYANNFDQLLSLAKEHLRILDTGMIDGPFEALELRLRAAIALAESK